MESETNEEVNKNESLIKFGPGLGSVETNEAGQKLNIFELKNILLLIKFLQILRS